MKCKMLFQLLDFGCFWEESSERILLADSVQSIAGSARELWPPPSVLWPCSPPRGHCTRLQAGRTAHPAGLSSVTRLTQFPVARLTLSPVLMTKPKS